MYRVLVAEGEHVTREALRALIGKVEGFEAVHLVASAEKAVDICCSASVDIAFLDAVLPDMPGLEAAERIHARVPSLPLVLVATTDSAAFAREALRYNASGYVTKPVSFAAMRDILLAHKDCHVFESPALVEGIREVIAARDFVLAYERIPEFAADILDRGGESGKGRRELLERLGQRLLTFPGCVAETARAGKELPVFDEQRLAVANGVALNLFEMFDSIFQRNCLVDYPVLDAAFLFVDVSIGEKIGLDDLVNNAAASQTHVSRIFKRHFNLSVMDYLHLRKIHAAKMRFTYAGHSASEVAFALGYSEAGYFSKVFKKYERMTVQRYKALLRE